MIVCGNCGMPFQFYFNVDHLLKEGHTYAPQQGCKCTSGVAVIVRTTPLCGNLEQTKIGEGK